MTPSFYRPASLSSTACGTDIVRCRRRAAPRPLRDPRLGGRPGSRRSATRQLDPLASGILPRDWQGDAPRAVLHPPRKSTNAHIELGVTTTTLDRGGDVVARDRMRATSELTAAMIRGHGAEFRGTYIQHLLSLGQENRRGIAPTISRAGTPGAAAASASDGYLARGQKWAVRPCACALCLRRITALAGHAIGERLGTGATCGLIGRVARFPWETRWDSMWSTGTLMRRRRGLFPRGTAASLPVYHADAGGRLVGGPRRFIGFRT